MTVPPLLKIPPPPSSKPDAVLLIVVPSTVSVPLPFHNPPPSRPEVAIDCAASDRCIAIAGDVQAATVARCGTAIWTGRVAIQGHVGQRRRRTDVAFDTTARAISNIARDRGSGDRHGSAQVQNTTATTGCSIGDVVGDRTAGDRQFAIGVEDTATALGCRFTGRRVGVDGGVRQSRSAASGDHD